MTGRLAALICAAMLMAAPALAQSWQCAPYARQVSGIQLYGDAASWWGQAAGRYARGQAPEVGAALVFKAAGSMRVGHVATVSAIVDSRTVRLTHANWSRRGGIEADVEAIDVSANNDWSAVKVWYAPVGGVGTSAHPAFGFIYPDGAARAVSQLGPRLELAQAVLDSDADVGDAGGGTFSTVAD